MLCLAAILPFVYGLKELVRSGWQWWPAVALVSGITAGVVFVRRQRNLETPLLDLRRFGNRTFRSALTLMFVTAVVGAGTLLLVTSYLQNVTGLSRGCPGRSCRAAFSPPSSRRSATSSSTSP
ncbi:hypothetical protein AB0K16_44900 [Nonomuraea jabiensis]|uniref:hypothetical protein n=1 Tax=Nonomuraea jabiensis TaxID=882448 RepID=UPI0034211505